MRVEGVRVRPVGQQRVEAREAVRRRRHVDGVQARAGAVVRVGPLLEQHQRDVAALLAHGDEQRRLLVGLRLEVRARVQKKLDRLEAAGPHRRVQARKPMGRRAALGGRPVRRGVDARGVNIGVRAQQYSTTAALPPWAATCIGVQSVVLSLASTASPLFTRVSAQSARPPNAAACSSVASRYLASSSSRTSSSNSPTSLPHAAKTWST